MTLRKDQMRKSKSQVKHKYIDNMQRPEFKNNKKTIRIQEIYAENTMILVPFLDDSIWEPYKRDAAWLVKLFTGVKLIGDVSIGDPWLISSSEASLSRGVINCLEDSLASPNIFLSLVFAVGSGCPASAYHSVWVLYNISKM